MGTLVSSTNKNDRHDIAEILLKVALNTINPNQIIVFGLDWIHITKLIGRSNGVPVNNMVLNILKNL
jgi:hypothetical protein